MKRTFAASIIFLTACATTTTSPARRVARHTVLADARVPVASTPQDDALMARHCYQECPIIDPEFGYGVFVIVARDGYVLAHSSTDKIPLWVAEFVERSQLEGNVPRHDLFAPDPKLKPGARAELADYKGSGYDRGHQAPAANQTLDQRLKDETFLLSNMAPQKGKLNQQLWAGLEDLARDWARDAGSAYMITGGFFYDPAEEDPAAADGTIEYVTIGRGVVAVPTHFYKIVITTTPVPRAIAFVAENRGYPRPFDFAALIKSIDWIEERTGIDFLPGLSEAEAIALEQQPSPLW